jgi:hypothetical protein
MLISQEFLQARLRELAFCRRYNNLLCQYNLPLGKMLCDVFIITRLAILDTLILTMVCTVYLKGNWGSWRVWQVDRGCVFILGTWCYFWYFQESVKAWFSLFSKHWFSLRIFTFTWLHTLNLIADCSVWLIWTHRFQRLKWGLWWVWPVDKGCLLLLGPWSHLYHIQRCVFALFSNL